MNEKCLCTCDGRPSVLGFLAWFRAGDVAGIVIDVAVRGGAAGGVRGEMFGEMEHLDHVAGAEGMDHGASGRLDFRGGFLHFDAGDALDLLAEGVGGTGEELAVKLLDLGGAGGALGQDSLRGR